MFGWSVVYRGGFVVSGGLSCLGLMEFVCVEVDGVGLFGCVAGLFVGADALCL